uniref:Carbonic anhydrase n=1 Tax=Oryzias sinensis TaxID=183150 RepID=A0A8C7Z685_9TELE
MQQLLILYLACAWTLCAGSGDWCYQSEFSCDHQCNVPENWDHASKKCAGGDQSPINIVTRKTVKDDRLTPLKFQNYQHIFRGLIKNNGHSVHIGISHPSTISGGGLSTTYKAVQFHLHWGSNGGPGSEHTIDGEQYPMELHIVHMKSQYNDLQTALRDREGVAVLGFFYEMSNSPNRKYETLINALTNIKSAHGNTTLSPIALAELIPPEQNMTSYFRYRGSLTTPDCSESVVWTVFENPIPLSMNQLKAFSELRFQNGKPLVKNFRPLQPLNGRVVFRSAGAAVLISSSLLMVALALVLELSQPN